MANEMIHMNYDKFSQAPGWYSDAAANVSNALSSLFHYKNALGSSGFENRCTSYNGTYNTINSNVTNVYNFSLHLHQNTTYIINQYLNFEAQNTGGTISAPPTTAMPAPIDPSATAAQVGSTDDDNTVWENIWGWICDAADAIVDFIEGLVATFLDIVSSLLQGLCSLVEGIIDCVILLGSAVVGIFCSAINFIFGTEIDVDAIKNWTMSFVATDWVGSAFHAFYTQTGFGRWMADESWIYDTWAKDVLVGAGKWVGIIAIDVALAATGVGAAAIPWVTAALAGTSGFGQGAQSAYANGASYAGGLGIGLLKGGFDAIIGYGVGNCVSALTSTYTSIVAKDGSALLLRRVGTGLGTKWQWIAMQGGGSAGTALVPVTTSTALSTYLATSVGPYLGALTLPTVLGYGAFGLGSVALGTLGLGALDSLTNTGGTMAPWADGGGGGNTTPTQPSQTTPGGTTGKENCDKCGKNPCECSTNCDGTCQKCGKNPCKCEDLSDQEQMCPNCNKLLSQCICQEPEQTCPTCNLPLSQCPGHSDGGQEPTCSTCGLPLSQCPGHSGGGQEPTCSTCGLPLSQCPGHSGGGQEPEQTCPTCGLPISQCPGHSGGGQEPEQTCPTCGLPISQCPGHSGGGQEPEQTCPTCGLPISQCPGHTEPNPDKPEEPGEEDRMPNVTFKNVGPEWIEMENTWVEPQPTPGNPGGGGQITDPMNPNPNPEPETPPVTNPTPEEPKEPVFEFESMTPTVENPDLLNIPAVDAMSNTAGVQNVTTTLGGGMENISITSLSDMNQPSNVDTSMLGMGGITFGAAAATMYGANRRETKEQKDKESFKQKVEDDKNKFEQI